MMQRNQPLALVTGITGFVGSHVALNLLQNGYRVRGTLRDPSRGDALARTLNRKKNGSDSQLELVEADLSHDAGWTSAMGGVSVLHHVASPFPLEEPGDPDSVIQPALDGTRRVLNAAKVSRVPRIVVTSSVATIMYGHRKDHRQPFSESDFTDPTQPGLSTYVRSKVLAEAKAWEFAQDQDLSLTTVHPGLVLGPLLARNPGTSVSVVQRLLRGKLPGCPRLHFPIVDVRDVAEMHRLAGESEAARGHRLACTRSSLWFLEMAQILREAFPEYGGKLPSREFPNWLVRLLSLFDPSVRAVLSELGLERSVSSEKAQAMLGWKPRPNGEAIRSTAKSLIRLKLV